MRRPRRNHAPAFKAKVALEAVKCEKTISQLAAQFDVPANQIASWKAQLDEAASRRKATSSGDISPGHPRYAGTPSG